MKFQALVVAAMVIASVNAGLPDKLPSEAENSSDESGSVSEQNLLPKDGDAFQALRRTKKEEKGQNPIVYNTDNDRTCTILLIELRDLYQDIVFLHGLFHEQMLISLDSKDKVNNMNTEEIEDHSTFQDEAASELEGIKKELASLEQTYHKTWDQFVGIGCSVESHISLSPEEMAKNGYFTKWQDEATRL
ncbi:hypothetical protein BASA50_008626 [Batrachochytrium salamandrivorans]|uniref:Uncharacterized protein n=1 Tax=Batrachochytrium salamandrivorans TaxID=1357716 RepID=A0ABQ8F4P8_9FUNG|nr:hypothetical protein BASA60_010677 [Batrachochytrium salamandrivorans]KAH6565170.1 hypothetical protein BASA62_007454 [Batrachochytrium salamandrivorans]KAH6583628.1 hypothetical protein BASA61_007914 [Batrachochytrium salamandrivorans]KAH6591551.1 hypothetical protein BASA50_008626 [Batrachochytrium salamandrivorans]KAH9248637.1 hypothetical protein BASA81_013709 [Batrachochytrium salamandrivorans]